MPSAVSASTFPLGDHNLSYSIGELMPLTEFDLREDAHDAMVFSKLDIAHRRRAQHLR